ncbi:hypothetical protein FHS92_000660 [Sphingobium subterraneum]|uniref:Uncharacterized protein n=1 Tax=Sphingobium subterraneum TaxID=627688 RepID=A0A841IWC2_9SPHN|nr:hypothetical protein [Sphingobium subterraneum]
MTDIGAHSRQTILGSEWLVLAESAVQSAIG